MEEEYNRCIFFLPWRCVMGMYSILVLLEKTLLAVYQVPGKGNPAARPWWAGTVITMALLSPFRKSGNHKGKWCLKSRCSLKKWLSAKCPCWDTFANIYPLWFETDPFHSCSGRGEARGPKRFCWLRVSAALWGPIPSLHRTQNACPDDLGELLK